MNIKHVILVFSFFCISLKSKAQCPAGEVMVTIDVQTDLFGYDCFWDLEYSGNACGFAPIGVFGNTTEVNCNSGGSQVATLGNGYGNNLTITETIGCFAIGTCFDLHYVDDFGDGGADFMVNMNGVMQHTFLSTSTSVSETYSFCADLPIQHDIEITTNGPIYEKVPLPQATNMINPVIINSIGVSNVSGVHLFVEIKRNGNVVHTATSPNQNLAVGASGNFSVPPYFPNQTGLYSIQYVAQMLQTDGDTTDNTLVFETEITDTVFALDDGNLFNLSGFGDSALIGNMFDIENQANLNSISVFLGSNGGANVGQNFTVKVFNVDATFTPLNVIASTTGTITNTADQWYEAVFNPPFTIFPGKYLFALEETADYIYEIGFSTRYFDDYSWYKEGANPWISFSDDGFLGSIMLRGNFQNYAGLSENAIPKIELFPNPTESFVQVKGDWKNSLIEIFDPLGKLIFSEISDENEPQIDLSAFASGIYTLKISSKIFSTSTRIVKL